MSEKIMRLYWSFGRNMNHAEMHRRAPDAVAVSHLRVNNGLLTFRRVADVEWCTSKNDFVSGGLWRISEQDERNLDRYEGYQKDESGLYIKKYLTLQINGKVEKCMYYKHSSEGVLPPSDEYVDAIAQGYRDFKLENDLILLEEALQRSWDNQNKTPDLHNQWIRKGRPSFARSTLKPTKVEVSLGGKNKKKKKRHVDGKVQDLLDWKKRLYSYGESRLIKGHANGSSRSPWEK